MTPTSPPASHPLDLDALQAWIGSFSRSQWPTMTAESEALALAEEAGEVCRAVVKRRHGVRGSSDAWTRALQREIAQVVVVAARLAALEGFSLAEALADECERWPLRDPDHDPVH